MMPLSVMREWPWHGAAAALASLLLLVAPAARGYGLIEAFESALAADTRYAAARAERDAALQALPIARAGLRPLISASISDAKVQGGRDIRNPTTGQQVDESLDYFSRARSISLRQTIYDRDVFRAVDRAELQVAYAEAAFEGRTKELANRLGGSYLDLMYALDGLTLARSQVQSFEGQLEVARRRFEGGEGTRTEIAEAGSRLDSAQADLLEALDRVAVARRSLQDITGMDSAAIRPPAGRLVIGALDPPTLDDWLASAEASSPEVQVRRLATQVARIDVERARSGHYPRVELVGSISRTSSDTLSTVNTDSTLRTIGLQISIPIYAGGRVDAGVTQAVANLQRSEAELAAELDTQRIEVRRQYLAVTSGIARIAAREKAVESSELALEGTRAGLRAGIRSNVDVLDAQQRLFIARRDLAEVRYVALLSLMRLQLAAGRPPLNAVTQVDALLRAWQ
ncbi:MAG: TolC family outer membrane protein [Burkholderiales bacterium]|nr:MAG: TolC family outer membrane protein [Burkholderiales bacterium]